jgi:hypothetical protein
LILKGCIYHGVFPPYQGNAEWTCVDTTSKLIVNSVLNHSSKVLPSEFNILTNHSTSFELIFQSLKLEGFKIKKCNLIDWREMISKSDSPLFPISFLLMDGLVGSRFKETHTSKNVNFIEGNLNWPTINISNIRLWIKQLKE